MLVWTGESLGWSEVAKHKFEYAVRIHRRMRTCNLQLVLVGLAPLDLPRRKT